MQLIGLTGGIASGKSTIARRLAELGAVHLDADAIAREVVEPGTPALAAIAERFGERILAADGSLDRAALGALVFADEESRLALNAIVHPAIQAVTTARVREAGERDPDAVVVYDVPLLVEAVGYLPFDLIVVAEAPAEERLRRLVEIRGLSTEEARRRISAQASDEERRAVADVVIDTAGTVAETVAQTDELWRSIRSPTAQG